ncbi:MAG: transposase [Planctomycetes bacterium]|nr:transposase [Planctomycetota bacterium]
MKKNERLRLDNESRLVKDAVRLGARERKIVEQAIKYEALRRNVTVHAIAVCSNHVHVVVGYSISNVEDVVREFKQAGMAALKECGMTGKIWAKKYDKRFCFDKKSLQTRVAYVNRHRDG